MRRTIGILATSVAVAALCIVTDASAVARGGGGGGGGGGGNHFRGGGGGEVVVAGMAAEAGFMDLAAFTAAAARFIVLLPTVAGDTWVTRLTPCTHRHLQATL
jgi:hypothetical protein